MQQCKQLIMSCERACMYNYECVSVKAHPPKALRPSWLHHPENPTQLVSTLREMTNKYTQ